MQGGKDKKRLDILLVDNKLAATRSRAKAEIMAGNVLIDGVKKDKPGEMFSPEVKITLLRTKNPYVSRGGLKLKKAVQEFAFDFSGKIVLDIGASTGGFTHCALEHGAARVYALDVGYGQLAWELRNDPRVVPLERVNIRYFKGAELSPPPNAATIDVSFISLAKVLPVVAALEINEVVCLVKPQFEAAPAQVGKKGVVKDKKVHAAVLHNVVETAVDLHYAIKGLTFSPLKGPQGNIEYLLFMVKEMAAATNKPQDYRALVEPVVELAHLSLQ